MAKLKEAIPISANMIWPRVRLVSLMQPTILNPMLKEKQCDFKVREIIVQSRQLLNRQ
jgi:hypothetical protein